MRLLAGLALGAVAGSSEAAPAIPANFIATQLGNGGLTNAAAMAIAPDGRIFVCLQHGQLRVIKNGSLLATPFLTVSVDSTGERGLLGVAVDPDFPTNRFVYVYYTTSTAPVHNRVSRFTAGLPPNGDVAEAGSELVLLELENLSGATNHNGGALHFGPDGKLYVAVGENANGANSQTLNNRLGKLLRLNRDGTIPADNPFYNSATGANRSIWALGLSNPYTFAFQPGSGRMFVNDVGQNTWEEINDGIAGSNYGWPTTEGPTSNPAFRSPLFAYRHSAPAPEPVGCAITGGAFYNPDATQFPSDYVGNYFFADFCGGWVRRFDPGNGTSTGFATGFSFPVDLHVVPDGTLYVLERGTRNVWRIQYATMPLTVSRTGGGKVVSAPAGIDCGQTCAASFATGSMVTLSATPDPGATFGGWSGDCSGTGSCVVTLSQARSVSATFKFSLSVTRTGSGSGSVSSAPAGIACGATCTASFDGGASVTLTPQAAPGSAFTGWSGACTGSGACSVTMDGVKSVAATFTQPALSIGDVALAEGNAGITHAIFTVTVSEPVPQAFSLGYATADASALAGSDYDTANATLWIPAGAGTASFAIPVRGDTSDEPNEAFLVALGNPSLGTIANGVAQATILDDDGRPASCKPVAYVPFTIGSSDHYCLATNLSYGAGSGAAITIAADDVLLDFAGFTLDGSAAGTATQAVGVYAESRTDVVVRRGAVAGFARGIFLDDQGGQSSGAVVRSMRLVRNSVAGVWIVGRRALVQGNAVLETGGSTAAANSPAYGIFMTGEQASVVANDVVAVKATGSGAAFGIRMLQASRSVVDGNRVGNAALSAGADTAIGLEASEHVLVQRNRALNMDVGLVFDQGSSGKYRGNLASGCATPYSGGVDAGSN